MGPALLFLAAVLIISAIVALSVHLTRDPSATPGGGARPATRFFLVMLRLVIGWHFLIEGLDKLKSDTWTSEAYLREASGPAAPLFRSMAGDRVRDRVLVADNKFPEPLAAEWQAYLEHFQNHYRLSEDQRQQAKLKMDEEKAKTLKRLTVEKKIVAFRPPQGAASPRTAELTIQELIKAYDDKLKEVRHVESDELPKYGPSVFAKLQQAKGDANRLRGDLKTELSQQTANLRKTLNDLLRPEQKQMDSPADPGRGSPTSWTFLDWSDFLVKYGLVATGACLLAGLLTRTFCVVGAGFLLMFFLAMPPLPGWPENPRAEGHYLYVNKNIIEMVALLALATTRSGRWAGLDALLHGLKMMCCPGKVEVASPKMAPATEIEESTENLGPGDPRLQSPGTATKKP